MSQIPDFTAIALETANEPISDLALWERDLVSQTGKTADALSWQTPEGIDIKCLYTAADLRGDMSHVDSFPGFAPFLRGPYPTMYTNQPWTV